MESDRVAVLLRLRHVAENGTVVASELVCASSLRSGAIKVLDDEGVDSGSLAACGAVETAGLSDVDDEGELAGGDEGELGAAVDARGGSVPPFRDAETTASSA